jgi:hypothetical protein
MIKSDISNLGRYSNQMIDLVCDSCGLEKSMMYKLYTSYGYCNNEYLCRKCKTHKNNLEKYGVKNVFQLESIKDKIKKTNLDKWGVENISQNIFIKNLVKESKLKLDNDIINKKRKKTVSGKYGVENISQIEYIKIKKENKNLLTFGVNHNKKNEFFRKGHFKVANNDNYLEYKSNGISIFRCDNNGDHNFEIDIQIYSKRIKYNTILCTICNPIDNNQSGKELSLYNYIKSVYSGVVIQNYKLERREIDIYLPEYNLGFEFNGIYWHSDVYKEKGYHIDKTNFFKDKNIKIFHIWEDEWDYKNNILKSQIKNLLKLNSIKIYARKCEVRNVEIIDEYRNFLNENHIQGYINSVVKIGLFYDDKLVSLMTFDHFEGRKKMNEDEWNLSRFCSTLDLNVIGGASKLLSYFVKNFKPKRIVSYADNSWSSGNLYEVLNFKKVKISSEDYKYVYNGKRIHKSNFKKSITNISESKLEIPKIWDCGKIKYEMTL